MCTNTVEFDISFGIDILKNEFGNEVGDDINSHLDFIKEFPY
jgi:hypothetical protein